MASDTPLIELQDVSKVYRSGKRNPVTAVKGVNLNIAQGEFVVITGRSGSGKTTLLNLISGLTRPTVGRVLLERTELWALPDAEQSLLRNKTIGFVFQFPSLIPSLTAVENVALPTIVESANHRPSVIARAKNLLYEVGLLDKLDSYPRELSAGEQQRVVVARSLINDPELLLADEPTSNLDEQTEQEIMALIRRLYEQHSITILLVTHSTDLARYGTRALQMAAGEIVGNQPTH
jgi:ABC-type lipoprotein export system ATPase subunit